MQQRGRWDKFRSRLCAKSEGRRVGRSEERSWGRAIGASPGCRFPNRNSKEELDLSICD